MVQFFENLKVVELASVLAGPAVGMFFAELGAKVVKYENALSGGDVTRKWRLPGETELGPSAYYASVNFKKEVRLIDLSKSSDRAALTAELDDADLVISNFQPRVAAKLDLLPETLRKRHPKLIIAVIEGYADSDKPAYDAVLQAETGWISMNGTVDQLAKLPVALIDELAAHQLKQACLLALIHRERTNEGAVVRCSLESASLSALANQASNYLMCEAIPQPMGTAHPNIAPYGDLFQSAEGKKFLLAIGSDEQFAKCCAALGLELHNVVDFATNTDRLKNRHGLVAVLQKSFAEFSISEITEKLDGAKIPFGMVKQLDQVLKSKTAIDLQREEIQEERRTIRLSGNAFTADFLDAD